MEGKKRSNRKAGKPLAEQDLRRSSREQGDGLPRKGRANRVKGSKTTSVTHKQILELIGQ